MYVIANCWPFRSDFNVLICHADIATWKSWPQTNLTNSTMHLSYIPQYTIENRNVHIYLYAS